MKLSLVYRARHNQKIFRAAAPNEMNAKDKGNKVRYVPAHTEKHAYFTVDGITPERTEKYPDRIYIYDGCYWQKGMAQTINAIRKMIPADTDALDALDQEYAQVEQEMKDRLADIARRRRELTEQAFRRASPISADWVKEQTPKQEA